MMFTKSKTQFYSSLCFLTLFCVVSSQEIFDATSCSAANLSNCTIQKYGQVTGSDVVEVVVKNVPSTSTFFVIQAHSFLNKIILSNDSVPKLHFYNEGTNVGLVQVTSGKSNFVFYLLNTNKSASLDVLIAVTLYTEKDPIPGGCNLVFDVENAPYQIVKYNSDVVEVSVQAPSVFGRSCEENSFNLEIYRIYLPENYIDSASYFNGIQKMLTVESIRKHGWRMYNKTNGHNTLRVMYSAYPGIGSVYAMIAVYKNGEAAYVPALTYACDMKNEMDDCVQTVTLFWKIVCGISIGWGLSMCLFGVLFCNTITFISTGLVFGAFLMYLINAPAYSDLLENYRVHITATSSVIYIVIWVAVWYKCRSLGAIIVQPVLNGMLIASFFFHAFIGDLFIFESNLNYWAIYWSIAMVVAVLQIVCGFGSIIITYNMFGAFITILAIDRLVGSYIRYIVINTIRRTIVENFNLAIISPPTQFQEILLYISCMVLTGCSFIFNMMIPGTSGTLSETTPLLG